MAEAVVLVTEPRSERGSQAARRLRKQGRLPGVVYGHKEETQSVSVSGEDFGTVLRHGVRVVDLKGGGKLEKALIKEVQWDHLGKEVLHVDFERVAADERITITVPVEIRGTAPGVAGGGLLDQPIHVLTVECLAVSIPQSIRVSVGELQIGGAIYVKDLTLPPDVKVVADPDAIVVHVTAPQAEPEPAAAPAAEQAEPEIIGRKAAEEEEGE